MQFPSQYDFDVFYEDTLKPFLHKADTVRKKILLNNTILITVMSVCFIAETMSWMLIFMLVMVVFFFWYTKYYSIPFFYLEQLHEKTIISHVSKFVFSGFVFDADRYIKLKDMQDGSLISGNPGQYSGKNLIETSLGTMQIQVSEIQSFAKKREGKKFVSREYFTGTVAIAKMPLETSETILIASESNLTDPLQELLPDYASDKYENSFFISCTDKKNLEQILPPSSLLLIKNYIESTKANLLLSITASGIYIGIERTEKNNLETRLFNTLVKKDAAQEYFCQLLFFTELFVAIEKKQLEKFV